MCDVCRVIPCLPGCPNAPEPRHVYICSGCGESICEGDTFYRVMEETFCEECIESMREEAEYDPY